MTRQTERETHGPRSSARPARLWWRMPLVGTVLAMPLIGPAALFIGTYGDGVYGDFWPLFLYSFSVAAASVSVGAILVGVPFELWVIQRRAMETPQVALARCLAYVLWGGLGGFLTYRIVTTWVLTSAPPEALLAAVFIAFAMGGATIGVGYTLYEQFVTHMHTSARVTQELAVARAIQQDLFPQRYPEVPGLRFAAHCTPARETGGDFYDFVDLGHGRVGVVVADVAGKSVAAALLMANARSIWRAAAATGAAPKTVLEQTNRALCKDIRSFAFVTLFYAVIDMAEPGVRFAGAGHPPPLLCHPRSRTQPPSHADGGEPWEPVGHSLRELNASGLPLGLDPGADYEEIWVSLLPGDALVLYTDGVVESLNARREMFGFERLNDVVEHLSADDPAVSVAEILGAVHEFCGPVEQMDDVTLLVIQVDRSNL